MKSQIVELVRVAASVLPRWTSASPLPCGGLIAIRWWWPEAVQVPDLVALWMWRPGDFW